MKFLGTHLGEGSIPVTSGDPCGKDEQGPPMSPHPTLGLAKPAPR